MASTLQKGLQQQIIQGLIHTEFTPHQISYRLGVPHHTVLSIARKILLPEPTAEIKRREMKLFRQITQLQKKKVRADRICEELGVGRAYFYTILKRGKQAAADTACSVCSAEPAAEDEQLVQVISIAGTPAAQPQLTGPQAGHKPECRAEESVKTERRIPQRAAAAPAALGCGAELGLQVGGVTLKLNLDELTEERTAVLCLLIERLGRGGAQ